MLTELGHEASVVGVARLYAPIAVSARDRSGRRTPRRRRRSGGSAVHRHAIGDEDSRDRQSLGTRHVGRGSQSADERIRSSPVGKVGPRRPAEVDAGPNADTANRSSSSRRSGPVDRIVGVRSLRPSVHRSRTEVCSPVPTLISSPLLRSAARTSASTTSSMKTKSRVWRPSPSIVRCQSRRRTHAGTTRRPRPPVAGGRRTPTTSASAANSRPSCSR